MRKAAGQLLPCCQVVLDESGETFDGLAAHGTHSKPFQTRSQKL
jgi:hypothetical protein